MQIFNPDAFDQLTAGDVALQQDLLVIAGDERSRLLEEARASLTHASSEREFAHKLQGFAANLCAPSLVELAQDWTARPADEREQELEVRLDELIAAIAQHLS